MSTIKDNETVYDEQISPLMAQILAICKTHGIPMLATFVYAPDGFCTSSLPVDSFYPGERDSEEHRALLGAFRSIKPPVQFAAFTIVTASAPKDGP